MSDCPCGSGRPYDQCCGPLISGASFPETAEALMRARYTAFTKCEIDYLSESLHPSHRSEHDPEEARKWAENSQWDGLKIVASDGGGPGDSEGSIEFIAGYRHKGTPLSHHEVAQFTRHKGRWYYVDGRVVSPGPVRNQGPKVGRNEPCPCGSGLKFKKCCG